MKKRLKLSVLLILSLVSVSGCNINSNNNILSPQKVNEIKTRTSITGVVQFPAFHTKADITDIAPKATVSLVYPSDYSNSSLRNVTVATGLTNSNGQFSINPGNSFNPLVGEVFVLEASKRLGGAGNNNISVRTHIKWNGENFDSITVPGIFINSLTTALSVISNLNPGAISAADTIGKIPVIENETDVHDINSLVSANLINSVKTLVEDALSANRDPVASIVFANGQYSAKDPGSADNTIFFGCVGEPGTENCVAPTPSPSSVDGCVGDSSSCGSPTPSPSQTPVPSTTPTATPTTDPDAQSFFTAAGITDVTQQTAVNQLVLDLKSYAIWSKMVAIYPFVGGTSSSHKYNLKDPRDVDAAFRLVFSGGWTHSSTGSLPDGSSAYADTLIVPRTQGVDHFSYYSGTNANTGTDQVDIGGYAGGNDLQYLSAGYTNYPSAGLYSIGRDGSNDILLNGGSTSDTRGFYEIDRVSGVAKLRRNGIILDTKSDSTVTPTKSLYIGAYNNNGSAAYFSNRECAFSSIGSGLTDTEASNLNTAVQNYQTTLGRN